MVLFTREYWVPGISMTQENTVWGGSEEDRVVKTDMSYIIPLRTVVVLVSPGTRDPSSDHCTQLD